FAIGQLQLFAQRAYVRPIVADLVEHLGHLAPQASAGPAQVGFEDLPDVHAAGHAPWVEDDVDRRAGFQIGHVLDRNDLGDDALVSVTAGHLVARLQLALHRDEDLDHLHHTRGQFVTTLQFLDLVVEALLELLHGVVELLDHRFDGRLALVVLDGEGTPLARRVVGEHLLGDLDPRLHTLRTGLGHLAEQQVLLAAEEAALQDRLLVVTVLGKAFDLGLFDGQSALVLVHTAAREDPHLDDGPGNTRRHPQRGIAHVGCLLPEAGPQQLPFRRHRRLALRRHLADEDVTGVHLGADVDNARLAEVAQGILTDVRDVAGDLLLAQLGVTRHDLELLDVDRGEDVIAGDPLADQDRVFEVVAVPGPE